MYLNANEIMENLFENVQPIAGRGGGKVDLIYPHDLSMKQPEQ